MIEHNTLSAYQALSSEIFANCKDAQDMAETAKGLDKMRLLALRIVPREGEDWQKVAYDMCCQGAIMLRDVSKNAAIPTTELVDRLFGSLIKVAEEGNEITITEMSDYYAHVEKYSSVALQSPGLRMRFAPVRNAFIAGSGLR